MGFLGRINEMFKEDDSYIDEEESFAVTHPVRDGQTQAGVVDINGLPGTCYRSSNASRPLQVVWLDYEQRIVFLLTGSMSCEELVTLAETVSPVN